MRGKRWFSITPVAFHILFSWHLMVDPHPIKTLNVEFFPLYFVTQLYFIKLGIIVFTFRHHKQEAHIMTVYFIALKDISGFYCWYKIWNSFKLHILEILNGVLLFSLASWDVHPSLVHFIVKISMPYHHTVRPDYLLGGCVLNLFLDGDKFCCQ